MTQSWFSGAELAKHQLAGLPTTKRRINALAARENWKNKRTATGQSGAKKRQGRGGGWEYHYSIFEALTVSDMVRKGLVDKNAIVPQKPKSKTISWSRFEAAPHHHKKVAEFRLSVISCVEDLCRAGFTKTAAIETMRMQHLGRYRSGQGDHHKFSRVTVFNWYKLLDRVPRKDWLPALLPSYRGGGSEVPIERDIIDFVRADYLRPERPSFSACYERLKQTAATRNWSIPHRKTLQRRFLDGIPYPVQVLKRDGYDALERMFPAQTRDRTDYHALEAINADGHIWDVFVHDKPGSKPYRPVTCAIQDLYSNKILGWRTGKTLGADLVRLAFGDVFRDYGIPSVCWLDNGREFAAKMVSGGTAHRFRFKVKEEEPTGFLTALGVDIRWTRPYRGQSKPIERAFRDFCDHIAKHPAFAGAYTGNMVTNKPANYGSRSIHIDKFKAIVDVGIRAHNAREGRRTAVCQGRSFDAVFKASYEVSHIRRASEEQLRHCLLAGEFRKSSNNSGSISILGNVYWSEEMASYAGDRFIVRFDPDNLHGSVFVYHKDGRFLCEAPVWLAEGFGDVKAARDHANKKKRFMKAQKELAELESPVSVDDVAAWLPEIAPEAPVEASVITPVFTQHGNAALKAVPDVDMDVLSANVEQLLKHKTADQSYD